MHKKIFSKTICFRRWTRKSYAVFNSLGKQIKIGVLALSLSMVCMSAEQVSAQATSRHGQSEREGETDAVPIDEVLVSATPTLAVAEPARVVTTIGRREIEQLPVQDIQQLLEHVAGIDLRQRGANNVQADISIRGGSYDQALILLNGINITDPQTGHYNLDLPVDLQSIDRVEILQGPGSRAMGPNAFSGAINIVTGSGKKSSAQAGVSGGSHGYFSPTADASLSKTKGQSNLQVLSAASLARSDGYTPNTDFKLGSYFAQARYEHVKAGSISAQLGYQHKDYGANKFYSLAYPNQFEATCTIFSSIDYHKAFRKISLHSAAYLRRHHDRFELFRSSAPAWYKGHNYHRSDVLGGSARLSLPSVLGTTVAGGELRGEHIYSNVLGERMGSAMHVKGEGDSAFFTHEKQRNLACWFVEQAYHHRRFSVSGGVQGSYSNDFGHYTCLNADAAVALTPQLRLMGSIGQTLRLPTFTDLYYRSATHLSNPQLRPEQATTGELGAKYLHSDFSLQSSVFYRRGKNIIDWVRSSDTSLWQSRNHIALNTLGLDLAACYTPQGHARRFVSSLQLGYTYLSMSKDARGLYSSNALDYLRHKLSVSGAHPLPLRLAFSWSAVHERRAGQYTDDTSRQPRAFAPVTLVDVKLAWSRRWLTLYLSASNVFDTRYVDYANLPQPGRWIKIGVQVKLIY